jgi:hypothetical protein
MLEFLNDKAKKEFSSNTKRIVDIIEKLSDRRMLLEHTW